MTTIKEKQKEKQKQAEYDAMFHILTNIETLIFKYYPELKKIKPKKDREEDYQYDGRYYTQYHLDSNIIIEYNENLLNEIKNIQQLNCFIKIDVNHSENEVSLILENGSYNFKLNNFHAIELKQRLIDGFNTNKNKLKEYTVNQSFTSNPKLSILDLEIKYRCFNDMYYKSKQTILDNIDKYLKTEHENLVLLNTTTTIFNLLNLRKLFENLEKDFDKTIETIRKKFNESLTIKNIYSYIKSDFIDNTESILNNIKSAKQLNEKNYNDLIKPILDEFDSLIKSEQDDLAKFKLQIYDKNLDLKTKYTKNIENCYNVILNLINLKNHIKNLDIDFENCYKKLKQYYDDKNKNKKISIYITKNLVIFILETSFDYTKVKLSELEDIEYVYSEIIRNNTSLNDYKDLLLKEIRESEFTLNTFKIVRGNRKGEFKKCNKTDEYTITKNHKKIEDNQNKINILNYVNELLKLKNHENN